LPIKPSDRSTYPSLARKRKYLNQPGVSMQVTCPGFPCGPSWDYAEFRVHVFHLVSPVESWAPILSAFFIIAMPSASLGAITKNIETPCYGTHGIIVKRSSGGTSQSPPTPGPARVNPEAILRRDRVRSASEDELSVARELPSMFSNELEELASSASSLQRASLPWCVPMASPRPTLWRSLISTYEQICPNPASLRLDARTAAAPGHSSHRTTLARAGHELP